MISDITNIRRGTILQVDESSHIYKTIHAEIPLKELLGYSSSLRSITGGVGSFSMEFARHDDMNPQIQETILKELRGY